MAMERLIATHRITGASFGILSDEEVRKITVKNIDNENSVSRLMIPLEGGLYDPAMGPTDKDSKCETCGLFELYCPGHYGRIELLVPLYNPLVFPELYRILQMICLNCHAFFMDQKLAMMYGEALHELNGGNVESALERVEDLENWREVSFAERGGGEMALRLKMNKNTLEMREWLIKRFFKSQPTKGCENCGACRLKLVKENNAQIMVRRKSKKLMSEQWKKGVRFESALGEEGVSRWMFYEGEAKEERGEEYNQRVLYPNEVRGIMERAWKRNEVLVREIWSSLSRESRGAILTRRSSYEQFFLTVVPVPPNRFRPMNVAGSMVSENVQNANYKRLLLAMKRMGELFREGEGESRESQKGYWWREMQVVVNDLFDSGMSVSILNKPPGVKQVIEKKDGLFRQNMMGKRVDFAGRSVITPDPYLSTSEIGVPMVFAKHLYYSEPVTTYNVNRLREMVINGPDVYPGANAVEDESGRVVPLRGDRSKRVGLANLLLKPCVEERPGAGGEASCWGGAKRVHRHLVDGDMLIVNRQPTLHKPSMMTHYARVLKGENTIRLHYSNCSTYNADFDGDEMNLHFLQNEMARAEAYTISMSDEQYIVPKDGTPIRGLIQDYIVSGVLLTKKDTFLTREEFQQLYCCGSGRWRMRPPAILKPRALWTGKQLVTALLEYLLRDEEPLNLCGKSAIPGEMWGESVEEGQVLVSRNYLATGSLGKNQFGAKKHGLVHAVYELYSARMAGRLLTILGRLLIAWLQHAGFTCGIDDLQLTARADGVRHRLQRWDQERSWRVAGLFLNVIDAEDAALSARDVQKIEQSMRKVYQQPELYAKWDAFMISRVSRVTSATIDACIPGGQMKPFPANNLSLMTVSGAKGSRVNFAQIACLLGQQELEGRRAPLMETYRCLPSFAPYDLSARASGYITDRFFSGVQPQEYFFHCMAGREGLIDTAVKTSRSGYLQRTIIKNLESLVVQYDYTVRDAADGCVIQFQYGEDGMDVCKSGYLQAFDFYRENLRAAKKVLGYEDAMATLQRLERPAREADEDGRIRWLWGWGEREIPRGAERVRSEAMADPGEMVGVLAGQSVGEPSTQMTLNTFHLAGRSEVNVTLGIPRLRELIQTDGSIKTPSMVLPLRSAVTQRDAERLVKQLQKISMSQLILHVTVVEELCSNSAGNLRVYRIRADLDPSTLADWYLPWTLVETRIGEFVELLVQRVDRQLQSNIRRQKVVYKSQAKEFSEYEEEWTAEQERSVKAVKNREDEGNDQAERKKRSSDTQVYEEEEEEPEEEHASVDGNENYAEEAEPSDFSIDPPLLSDDDGNFKHGPSSLEIDKSSFFFTFTLCYPASTPKILLVSLIDDLSSLHVVRQVPGIEKAALIHHPSAPSEDGSVLSIQTAGINFGHIFQHHHLFLLNSISTNDVRAIYKVYGIEAARRALHAEILSVFQAYGILVDSRHLSLVSDYMTHSGSIRAMTRFGITTNASPFLKMSYETTTKVLTNSVIYGEYDNACSPSAALVLGLVPSVGTGMCEVRCKI
ncbi:DNA-directed RNA polymerase I subunit rpa1-like [Schistocerca gregaria]|uniref:DNA-directed RNA polymerase I subunit rpa1-like n=1 Tax=Schistocerca gregaria TaxID=7010 RepID=UPI00211E35CD|nr:DNA-directed RNA polymerase I subunit rpa1-like [Schistocerca gregaria]